MLDQFWFHQFDAERLWRLFRIVSCSVCSVFEFSLLVDFWERRAGFCKVCKTMFNYSNEIFTTRKVWWSGKKWCTIFTKLTLSRGRDVINISCVRETRLCSSFTLHGLSDLDMIPCSLPWYHRNALNLVADADAETNANSLGWNKFVCIEIDINWIQFSISKGKENLLIVSNVCFSLDLCCSSELYLWS